LSKTLFLSYSFDSRCARKAIKSFKDVDNSLDSKKAKNWLIGLVPKASKVGQKMKTCSHYDLTHRKAQNKFFLNLSRRLAESAERLNNSLVQTAGEFEL